ncbi:hypothetical protein QQF64_024501 [Cirrhinus molitorella]|uniref:Uncharacterized protein n=1 Tax=Cirrhinus molitorella TaxID=172907 RepID=A0ABR3NLF2_9TELE
MNLSSCTRVDRSSLWHLSLSLPPLSLFLLFTSLPLRCLSSGGGSRRHRKSAFLMCPPLVLLFLIEGAVFLQSGVTVTLHTPLWQLSIPPVSLHHVSCDKRDIA